MVCIFGIIDVLFAYYKLVVMAVFGKNEIEMKILEETIKTDTNRL